MKWETRDGMTKLCIHKEDVDSHILLIGTTRFARKTTWIMRIIYAFYNMGYKIVVPFDVKGSREVAHCQFPPKRKWHIKKVQEQEEEPFTLPCEVWHPVTKYIPNIKMPEVKFYTSSIKSLGERELAFISGVLDPDNFTVRLMRDAINDLSSNEGFYDFIHRADELINENTKTYKALTVQKPNPKNFWLREATMGGKTNIKELGSHFRLFGDKYDILPIFMEDNFDMNIDWLKLLNDQKTVSLFTNFLIPAQQEKLKDYINFHPISQMFDTIMNNQEKIKHPILFVLDEIRYMIPKNPKGYQFIFASTMKDFFSIIAGMGQGVSSVSGSQTWFDVSEEVMNSFSKTFWGKLESAKEYERIGKALSLSSTQKTNLKLIEDGDWIPRGDEDSMAKESLCPPFALPDKEWKYEDFYRKQFPDKLTNYSDVRNRIQKIVIEMEKKAKDKSFARMEKEIDDYKKKLKFKESQNAKTTKLEGELIKHKEKLNVKKEERNNRIKEFIIKYPEMSNREIAQTVGVSHPTVSTIRKELMEKKFVDNYGD